MKKARSFNIVLLIIFGLIMMSGLFPSLAFAGSSDLAGTSQTVAKQLVTIPKLIAFLSYVAGTGFAVRALFALKGYIEKPDDAPINVFIGFATLSTLLILLPYSLGLTANTLGTQTSNIYSTSESFEAKTACEVDKTLNAVFCNLVVNFSPFARFLSVISYVIAAALTLTGLLNLKEYGDDPSKNPLRSIIMKFVIATMLISLPFAMQVFVTSVTGAKSIDAKTDAIKKPILFKGNKLL